jgi:adenylate kinase
MRAALLGPPGSGKGAQADRLAAALDVPPVHVGLLRDQVTGATALGVEARPYIDRGDLVPRLPGSPAHSLLARRRASVRALRTA